MLPDEYQDAEYALERGRNIETVRSNAAHAARHFKTAETAAQLASTALAQVLKSRQDGANAKAPTLAPEIWAEANRINRATAELVNKDVRFWRTNSCIAGLISKM